MNGTVRGAFDLDTGPAIRGVRDYKRAAAEADVQTRMLGEQMDRTFSRERVTQIDRVERATRDVGTASAETRTVVRREWEGMRHDIERETTRIVSAIELVHERLRRLGRERATPRIDIDGVARAISQVEILQARLAALGATRVSAGVGIGGGFGGGGGGGARGFARGSSAGGGGSGILSLGGVGFAGLRGGTLLATGAAVLPAGQAVLGGAAGLVGSAGAGLGGAGATGLGGLAPLLVGIGGIVSAAKPAQAALSEAWKQQDKLTEAIREHGKASKEARTEQAELNRLTKAAGPGAGGAMREARAFGREWRELTSPARRQYFGFLQDTAATGRRVAPRLARNATVATTALRGAGGDFVNHLAGDETQGNLSFFTRTFARELPTVERSLENVSFTVQRIARAATPFFHEANDWVEKQTLGWRRSTSDIKSTRREIGSMVDSAKRWADLTGDTWRLLRDIGHAGRPSGDSLVGSLDQTIERWDSFITHNPRAVRGFFDDSADSVRGMSSALAGVVGYMHDLADVLRPILDRFSQLVQFVSALGLAGSPGLLLGARAGVGALGGRGRGAGPTAGAGGAGGGMAPIVLAGGGRGVPTGRLGVPAGYARSTYATARGFGYGRAAAAGASGLGMLQGVGGLGRGALGAAGRAYLPLALGFGALDLATFQGGPSDRLQAAASTIAPFVPRPLTGAQQQDQGIQLANDALRGLHGSQRSQVRQLRGLTRTQEALAAGDPRLIDAGLNKEGAKALVSTLRDELTARQQLVKQMHREREQRRDDLSRQRGAQYGAELPGAFNRYIKAGQTPTEAAESTTQQAQRRLRGIRDAGVESLGESSLAWARALAKENPAMKKQVDELTDSIRKRFKRMGEDIHIVNGNILTGSKTEWHGIRDAMTSATEQAKEKTSEDFTAIQRQAIGSLMSMGFTKSEARGLVTDMEKGGAAGASANRVARGDTKTGDMGFGTSDAATRGKKARGGMIGGRGLMDTVPTPDGGLAAPGEAWIANRHTLDRLSMATRAMFGLTAKQVIGGETRPHWMPGYALGGETRGLKVGAGAPGNRGRAAGMGVGGLTGPMASLVAQLDGMGFRHGSTTGGVHAPGSFHYRGMAVDYGDASNDMGRLWGVVYPQRRKFAELFGPSRLKAPTLSHFGQAFSDPGLQAEHENHIHMALAGGGARGGVSFAGAGAGGGLGHIRVHGRGVRQGGLPGLARKQAGDLYARALQRHVNRQLDGLGGGGLGGFAGGGDAKSNMRLGHRMMRGAGWGEGQWPSLRELWNIESGWSQTARNPTSGAFGIPQALGHGDIGSGAAAQIRWGLDYIRGRYGSPSSALAFHKTHNWYERGGPLKWAGAFDKGGSFVTDGPTAFVAGEGPRHRRERVKIESARASSTSAAINFHPGAVVVQIGAGADVSEDGAEMIGEMVARKIIEALDRGRTTAVID